MSVSESSSSQEGCKGQSTNNGSWRHLCFVLYEHPEVEVEAARSPAALGGVFPVTEGRLDMLLSPEPKLSHLPVNAPQSSRMGRCTFQLDNL